MFQAQMPLCKCVLYVNLYVERLFFSTEICGCFTWISRVCSWAHNKCRRQTQILIPALQTVYLEMQGDAWRDLGLYNPELGHSSIGTLQRVRVCSFLQMSKMLIVLPQEVSAFPLYSWAHSPPCLPCRGCTASPWPILCWCSPTSSVSRWFSDF